MKTISIPTNDRVELLAQTLESLHAAEGIADWVLVFSCEPDAKVERLVADVGSWASTYVHRNPCKMGCWVNTFLAANFAMQLGSDLNLYLEDDIIISRDALTLVDQFEKTNAKILALRRPESTLAPNPIFVKPFVGGLFGDGFAWRKDLWPLIRCLWFAADGKGNLSMWDLALEEGLRRANISQVRPLMNRSQNIGITGTHQKSYDANRHSPCYTGQPISRFIFQP